MMNFFKSFKLTAAVGVSALLMGCPEAQQFSVQSMNQGIPGMVELIPGDNRCQLADGALALLPSGATIASVQGSSEEQKIPLPSDGNPIEWVCNSGVPGECADCNPFQGGGCPYPKEKHCEVVAGTFPVQSHCSCEVSNSGDSGAQPPAGAVVSPVQEPGRKPFQYGLDP